MPNKFLEKKPNVKLRSRIHYWKETNRIEVTKFLAVFLLQGLHHKSDSKSYISHRKILETPIYLGLFTERRFHLLLKFRNFVDNESYDDGT
jgi:hypothetical protein